MAAHHGGWGRGKVALTGNDITHEPEDQLTQASRRFNLLFRLSIVAYVLFMLAMLAGIVHFIVKDFS